ncbi:MAG: hypothetical protein WCA44_17940 [Acidobacteriaceae bacterium]
MERVSDDRLREIIELAKNRILQEFTTNEMANVARELLERRKAEQPIGQQAATEIPPAITDADIRAIQAIREAWDMVTDAELLDIKGYLGAGVSAYQFWLELHYARAEAELAQIKERYSTYRAASSAQAKLFAAQIEMLKEQLASARNKALKEAAEVCDSLGAETASYEGKAEDHIYYTFTELWAHRAYGQFHCAKAIRALQTPNTAKALSAKTG